MTEIIEEDRIDEKEYIPDCVAAVLFADLKSWASGTDITSDAAFRYQMFAQRITAAQYGRPDAVEWACNWYCTLVDELRIQMQEDFAKRASRGADIAASRALFNAGRIENPLYQAFLDTIEDPSTVQNNVAYMGWNSEQRREYEKSHPKRLRVDVPDYQPTFLQFVRHFAEAHLSDRVKAERASQHPSQLADGIADLGRLLFDDYYRDGYPWQTDWVQESGCSIAQDGKDILAMFDRYTSEGVKLRDAIRHAEIVGDHVPLVAYEKLMSLRKVISN